MEPTEFLERHRPRMLEILKHASPELQGNQDVLRFLDQVEADFEQVASTPLTRPYLPGEDVFWWCHDTLYQLTDVARPARRLDRYTRSLIADLRTMGGRLERNEGLPPGKEIGWFDETEEIDD